MKILWVSHLVPYPPKGGVLQRSYNLLREMAKYHEITLVCFNQHEFLKSSLPEVSDPLETAKYELGKFVDVAEILDIPESTFPLGRYLVALKALVSGKAYNMAWLESSIAHRVLNKLVVEREFDAVHLDTISLCVYSDIFLDYPVVLNHHNFESEMLRTRAADERNFVKSLYYKFEAGRLLKSEISYCRKATLNLTCSDDDAFGMAEITGMDNFFTVPNGVDVSYFYPNLEAQISDKNIVIVGGLSWYPNREAVEYFFKEIWPLVKQEVPGVSVDIIGRSPTREILEFAERDPSVMVHGFVSDVRDYLWRSHIYVCPIRTGGGTKLKILDALASGCCIVADPFACKGINVKEGEHVLFANTPAEYVRNIKHLLGKPELSEKLKRQGPRLIRQMYNYQSIGESYSGELKKLVGDVEAESNRCESAHENCNTMGS